jgi:predicted nucleic acid-binding protein
MVNGLLDTSIIVDYLRGYAPMRTWFLGTQDLAITRITWLEIIEGVRNKQELETCLAVLRQFPTIEIESSDMVKASEFLSMFYLSHNVDSFDCLIASVTYRLQLPLFTRNIKHFAPTLGHLAQVPY